MQREYLILMQGEKSFGAVKLEMAEKNLSAEITVDKVVELGKNEVLKAYLVMPQTGEVRGLGAINGHKEQFALQNTTAPIGIAITVKDTAKGTENYLCHCAEEGKLAEVYSCFAQKDGKMPSTETETQMQEPQAEKMQNAPLCDVPETKAGCVKEYLRTADQKLEKITEEYETEKINGYFLKGKSRILEYIMGGQEVYRRIMRYGFYIFSRRETENGEEFIISVPCGKNEGNPFKNCEKYAFKLESDISDDVGYYCVSAGKDEEGEFFNKP